MYRHRKDGNYHLVARKYPFTIVDQQLNDASIYVAGDSVPVGSTNVSLSAVDPLFGTASLQFSNGQAPLGTHKLGYTFTFDTWVYPTTANQHKLLSGDNTFEIVLDTSANQILMRRLVYGGVYEQFSIPVVVPLNQWTHIAVTRYYEKLTVVKNLVTAGTLNSFFYTIPSATVTLGKNLNNVRLCNSRLLLNSYTFPGIHTDLNAFKKKYNTVNRISENAEAKVIDLHEQELVNSSYVYPFTQTNTYYYDLADYWQVSRAVVSSSYRASLFGLTIVPSQDIKIYNPYTLELSFNIPTNQTVTNIVLGSQWTSDNRSWFVWYDVSDNNVKFTYLNGNVVVTQTVGAYVANEVNHFAFVTTSTTVTLFFNGEQKQVLTVKLPKLHRYQFNWDNSVISNTGAFYHLYKFTVSNCRKYSGGYLPYISSRLYKSVPSKAGIYDYHYKDEHVKNKRKSLILFEITGANSVVPNSTTTYTVTLAQKQSVATVIKLEKQIPVKDELVLSDITIPASVTIPAGNLTVTFNVQLGAIAYSKMKKRFYVNGYSKTSSHRKLINVNDSRTLSLSTVSGTSGYITGYIGQSSVVNGQIPNLSNSATATTTATKVTSMHGIGHVIDSVDKFISFPDAANVRTAILVYRELVDTPYRGYFGHQTNYTFNGGGANELVGEVFFNPNEYTKALTAQKKISKLRMSENGAICVVVDETAYKVSIYERANGVWSANAVDLNLGFGDTTVVVNASVDVNTSGTVVALGFPNANNGEGVVQVWKRVSGVWVKDLHLGSPTPAPYTGGFGKSVAIDDNGTRLFSSQIGSNNVFIFEKQALWDASPVETLFGANRFGFTINCDSAGTRLLINEVDTGTTYVYDFGSIWSLSQTINFGTDCKMNRNGDFIAINNSTLKTVKVYTFSGSFVESKSIIGNTNFGYAVSVNNNKDLLVGSPTEHKVYQYLAVNNYNSSTVYNSVSTAITDFYGYSVSLSNKTFAVTNFFDTLDIITNDGTSVPQIITQVRQDYAAALLTDRLKTFEPQVLTFYTSSPITVNRVGRTVSNASLNGIVYGWFLYNRVLTNTEILNIEDNIKKFFSFNTNSLYEN